MGKGDRKTAKGKRYNSSYGNARTKAATKATGSATAPDTQPRLYPPTETGAPPVGPGTWPKTSLASGSAMAGTAKLMTAAAVRMNLRITALPLRFC